jgi:type I restriction enzyme, S subunit
LSHYKISLSTTLPAIDLREYFDLPKSWVWDFVGHLSNVVRGASPRPDGNPKYFGGDIPWITVGYLTADDNPYLTIDKISTFLTEEGKKKSRFIEAGTLMLTNRGATLGVPKIIKFGCCFNDGSVALLNIDHPLKLYLYYFLRFLTSRYRAIHQGAAQPNLNIDIVKSTPVPIPPIEEQNEIVQRVEKLFKAIDLMEQEYQKASKLCDRLEQTTLAKAFRGELVPQDPNDEPAAALLERIRAERQEQPKRKVVKSKQQPGEQP